MRFSLNIAQRCIRNVRRRHTSYAATERLSLSGEVNLHCGLIRFEFQSREDSTLHRASAKWETLQNKYLLPLKPFLSSSLSQEIVVFASNSQWNGAGMKFISIPYHKSLTETKQFTYTLHPIPKIVCNQFSKANTQCDTIMEAAEIPQE